MKNKIFSLLLILGPMAHATSLEDFKCSAMTNVAGSAVTVTFSVTDRSDIVVPATEVRYGSGTLSLTFVQNGTSERTQDATVESFEKKKLQTMNPLVKLAMII